MSPDGGEHSTLTEPCPSFTGGVSKLTAMPDALTVARETPSVHVSVGGAATGGGGGGGGVGAVGELHAAPSASVTINADPTAQYFTKLINMN
jgi:hypothetical protein